MAYQKAPGAHSTLLTLSRPRSDENVSMMIPKTTATVNVQGMSARRTAPRAWATRTAVQQKHNDDGEE
jgi:hypothetical protein